MAPPGPARLPGCKKPNFVGFIAVLTGKNLCCLRVLTCDFCLLPGKNRKGAAGQKAGQIAAGPVAVPVQP
eukprot:SAG31_NODE_3269_length_4478_cov_2.680521_2_plen_70_part_00